MASGKKGIRSDKESGPIRISDHIYDWFIYGNRLLTQSEIDYIEKYERLEFWHDHSVYKNSQGEVYPEVLKAMTAMHGYDMEVRNRAQQIQSGQKQWFES